MFHVEHSYQQFTRFPEHAKQRFELPFECYLSAFKRIFIRTRGPSRTSRPHHPPQPILVRNARLESVMQMIQGVRGEDRMLVLR